MNFAANAVLELKVHIKILPVMSVLIRDVFHIFRHDWELGRDQQGLVAGSLAAGGCQVPVRSCYFDAFECPVSGIADVRLGRMAAYRPKAAFRIESA